MPVAGMSPLDAVTAKESISRLIFNIAHIPAACLSRCH